MLLIKVAISHLFTHIWLIFGKKYVRGSHDKLSKIEQTEVHIYSYSSGKVGKWGILLSKFGESDVCVCVCVCV